MDVSELRRQHAEIARVATQLAIAIANADAHQPIAAVRWKLARLLMTHLAMEDRLFYPAIEQMRDPDASAIATRFRTELGGLADRFNDYMRQWTDERVEASWPDFCADTQVLLLALSERMAFEDSQLYPLAERATDNRAKRRSA